jgi:site-specific recombinase XerD
LRKGELQIVTSKGRRTDILPMPVDVGNAIADYLQNGRPTTSSREVFVTQRISVGKPLSRRGVGNIVRKSLRKVEIKIPNMGSHALRHTAATRLIQNGASVKDIADLMRHRSIETTTIYAKVDLPKLLEVVMPWIQVQS